MMGDITGTKKSFDRCTPFAFRRDTANRCKVANREELWRNVERETRIVLRRTLCSVTAVQAGASSGNAIVVRYTRICKYVRAKKKKETNNPMKRPRRARDGGRPYIYIWMHRVGQESLVRNVVLRFSQPTNGPAAIGRTESVHT